MGFMAGFGRGISEGLERNAQRKAKREDALLSTRLKLLMDNNANLAKAKSAEAANIKKAKALSGMIPGAPEGIWKDLFHKVSAGVSDNKILDFYKDVDYIKDAPKPEVPTPTVEAQTDEALHVAPIDPTVDVSKPKSPKLGLVDHLNQRSNERMAVTVDNAAKDVMGEEAFNAAQQPFEAADIGTSGYTAKSKPKKDDEPKYLSTVPTKTNIIGLIGMANKAGDTESATYLTELQKAYADKNAGLPDLGTITTIEKWNGVKSQLSTLEVKPEGYEAWEKAFNNHGKFLGEQDNKGGSPNELGVDQLILNAQRELAGTEQGTPEHTKLIAKLTRLTDMQKDEKQRDGDTPEMLSSEGQIVQTVVGVDQGTGKQILLDKSSGQPVSGPTYFEITPTTKKIVEEFVKFNNTAERKYLDSLDALPSTAKLSHSIIQEIEANREAVTSVASVAGTVLSLGREFKAATSLFSQKDAGEISDQEFTSQLNRVEENYLRDMERGGVDVHNLANAADRIKSKVLLLTFRIGRMEGQSGMAMSNADREIFMKILQGSEKNPDTIISTIQRITHDYVKQIEGMSDQSHHSTAKKMIRAFPEINKDIFQWKSLTDHMGVIGKTDTRSVEAINYFLKYDGYSSESASKPKEEVSQPKEAPQSGVDTSTVSVDDLQRQLDALNGVSK